MTDIKSPVIVALDFASDKEVYQVLDLLDPSVCRIKINQVLFTRYGPTLVQACHSRGFEVFLDLKFHDIPNTVYGSVKAAADLGVWMCTLHALGGVKMLQAARKALDDFGGKGPILVAVTILTSMNEQDVQSIGSRLVTSDLVPLLADLAVTAHLDGAVCSPIEAALLRKKYPNIVLVTPGVRLPGAAKDDQERVLTPKEAQAAGANYLVIGRPITQAADPGKVISQILEDVCSA